MWQNVTQNGMAEMVNIATRYWLTFWSRSKNSVTHLRTRMATSSSADFISCLCSFNSVPWFLHLARNLLHYLRTLCGWQTDRQTDRHIYHMHNTTDCHMLYQWVLKYEFIMVAQLLYTLATPCHTSHHINHIVCRQLQSAARVSSVHLGDYCCSLTCLGPVHFGPLPAIKPTW